MLCHKLKVSSSSLINPPIIDINFCFRVQRYEKVSKAPNFKPRKVPNTAPSVKFGFKYSDNSVIIINFAKNLLNRQLLSIK